ncbi:MAG: sodium:solute symporter [Bacteroidales bacterium]|jgi:Na+/proline symporter|nr:sodium:solute symporter [Bacteroidales bacterium]MDD2812965.1 sodium:solute symporter [Bacteroidales bacterium]MDD3871268.1 sodium:solute symporter [Bacteroidales bacterium]
MSPVWIAIILVGYFALLLIISKITSRGANNESFFIGNRQSPWYIVAIGMLGASISGVTFISVPGWVLSSQFAYMQMVFGYLAGYHVIIWILLPLYYKLRLTSIYTYLGQRFGFWSYKSGAFYFLLSRTIGSAARLFIVSAVLQMTLFDALNIPFWANVLITIGLIWLYTYRGGIKTIIWTDSLQALLLVSALVLTIVFVLKDLNLGLLEAWGRIREEGMGQIFFWEDFAGDRKHFIKYFLGGMFITITMTGLDQDMMQKNLSCRTLRESQKNMFWSSLAYIPINFLFLMLGGLLILFAAAQQIGIPGLADDLFPMIAMQGYLHPAVSVVFIIGLVAAAFSSADSAMTALTTSITIDILNKGASEEAITRKTRYRVHLVLSAVFLAIILLFRSLNNKSIIDTIFTIAGYTYGPLLGLFVFGMFTRWQVRDRLVPLVVLISPIATFLAQLYSGRLFNGYVFGFELLLFNGLVTFLLLLLIRKKRVPHQGDTLR